MTQAYFRFHEVGRTGINLSPTVRTSLMWAPPGVNVHRVHQETTPCRPGRAPFISRPSGVSTISSAIEV